MDILMGFFVKCLFEFFEFFQTNYDCDTTATQFSIKNPRYLNDYFIGMLRSKMEKEIHYFPLGGFALGGHTIDRPVDK